MPAPIPDVKAAAVPVIGEGRTAMERLAALESVALLHAQRLADLMATVAQLAAQNAALLDLIVQRNETLPGEQRIDYGSH